MEVIKTVKQYSNYIDNYLELEDIARRYGKVKNYCYSRFSGINSLLIIQKPRKIRDEWVAEGFGKQWGLPARYWKLALDESISNIKTNWSNLKKRIKECVNKNEELTSDELHYIRYILKADSLYYNILTLNEVDIPSKFKDKEIRFSKIHKYIRRLTRRYKNNISHIKDNRSFSIDADMYKYLGDCKIGVTGLNHGKRIIINLTDTQIYTGNMRVVLKGNNKLEIHKPLKIGSNKSWVEENIIGIDKGYKTLIVTSSGNEYGKGLNEILSKETERLNAKNKKRNQYYSMKNSYLSNKEVKKADNIINNNLGKKKYNRVKNKYDSMLKSYINQEINRMFRDERPSELVMENLDFVSWDNRYPKGVKRKLSRWVKGYIKERLEYKCSLLDVKITYVNAAYTSQECSLCGRLGKRDGGKFECNCGNVDDADKNAAKVIRKRIGIKEISLYTTYKKVKEIISGRN